MLSATSLHSVALYRPKEKKIKLYMVGKSELPTLYRRFKTTTTYIFILFCLVGAQAERRKDGTKQRLESL